MKKINILFCLSFGFILFLSSCVRTEADLFDESAALRINRAVSDSKEILLSAANGWVMEYFPTNEQAGVTFLIKFDANGMATVATKNEYVTTYSEGKGEWAVIPESGPVLTFNTYINIFHLFSNPSSGLGKGLGLGLEGDYEFIIMDGTGEFIQLKGKKRGTDIRLYRLNDDQNWEEYFNQLNEIDASLFNKNIPNLILSVGDSLFTLSNGISHIFDHVPYGVDPIPDKEEVPFIVADYGIRFAKPFEVGDQSVQTFKLSDDKNNLVCTDENVDAKIEGPEIISFFHEAIDSHAKRWTLASEENSMSPEVKDAYARLTQAFESKKITLGQVSYLYSERNNTNTVYIAPVKGTGGYLYFDREIIAEGVKYTFKETFDGNGKAFYDNYDGTVDLIKLMSGSFKIEAASSKLNPSKVKLTNILDENVWFTVFLQ